MFGCCLLFEWVVCWFSCCGCLLVIMFGREVFDITAVGCLVFWLIGLGVCLFVCSRD